VRISRSVFAAVLGGAGAIGLAAGFAIAGGPAHLASGNARASVTRPAGSAGTAAGTDAVLAALLRPATATAADPIFMFINGINGESQDARHPMWSDLTGYHVSFSGRTSAAGAAGRPKLGSFVVTMPYSLAVPPLLQALVTGKVLPMVKIQAATAGEVELNYLTITLGNVRVAALNESSSGERPVETLSFVATKFDVSYTAQNPDGSLGKTETFCFNFAAQRTC
jgi:type VI protein secretion system component Hcp